MQVRYEPAPLILSFAVTNGKIGSDVKAFRRGYGRDVWLGEAKVCQSGTTISISVELKIADDDDPGEASYDIELRRDDETVTGSFRGTCRDQRASGKTTGRFSSIEPETPRDWNVIGQTPEKGKRLSDIDTVGVCWVHLAAATVYFGPDVQWGDTWASADSWKSPYVKRTWAKRRPDGTHPWDPFAGGGSRLAGAGDGRLVFGCQFERAAVLNESVTMGRPDHPEGFGPDGYYLFKFGPRIAAYGSRVFVANNRLPISRGCNFKYEQTTRRTFPSGGGAGMGFDEPRKSVVLFDYNKSCGIDINKCLFGLTKGSITDQQGSAGYFSPLVAVVDNYVYNNGHKGFNVSGDWVTIARNHNERQMLREGYDPERIGGWELTLDGHLESSPGGNGAISDNLSRAFDLSGRNVWVHGNTYSNTGSSPGNDGEGILCQAHGGTQIFSWAITYNRHEQGDGELGYIGGWDVNIAGALFGWNKTAGWIGSTNVGKRDAEDVAFVGNKAEAGEKPMKGAQVGDPGGRLRSPTDVNAEVYEHDAVRITWRDGGPGEVGFRVERQIDGGRWTPIAYRPPCITGHAENRQAWIDFLAPPGVPLSFRVVAIDSKDDDRGASQPVGPVVLPSPKTDATES
jgi:hypothetical protein